MALRFTTSMKTFRDPVSLLLFADKCAVESPLKEANVSYN